MWAKIRKERWHGIVVVVLTCLLCTQLCYAQSNLPPVVQADLLRDQIYAEAKANDSEAVLRSIDQYKKLGIEFPTPLLWIEAKAAHDSGDAQRALRTLGDFLAKTDRGSQQYKEALALYPRYQAEASAVGQQQVDARRAALSARTPEVLREIRGSLVVIPAGCLAVSEYGEMMSAATNWSRGNVTCAGRQGEINVKSFRLMGFCVNEFWWGVFVADTGRVSRDDYTGGRKDQCIQSHFTHQESWNNPKPNEFISLKDIDEFVMWVSSHDDKKWRLPTEAELRRVVSLYSKKSGEGAAQPQVRMGDFCNPGWTCSKWIYYEVVSDCWHEVAFKHSRPDRPPSDGSAWITNCEGTRTMLAAYYLPSGNYPEGSASVTRVEYPDPPHDIHGGNDEWGQFRLVHAD